MGLSNPYRKMELAKLYELRRSTRWECDRKALSDNFFFTNGGYKAFQFKLHQINQAIEAKGGKRIADHV